MEGAVISETMRGQDKTFFTQERPCFWLLFHRYTVNFIGVNITDSNPARNPLRGVTLRLVTAPFDKRYIFYDSPVK